MRATPGSTRTGWKAGCGAKLMPDWGSLAGASAAATVVPMMTPERARTPTRASTAKPKKQRAMMRRTNPPDASRARQSSGPHEQITPDWRKDHEERMKKGGAVPARHRPARRMDSASATGWRPEQLDLVAPEHRPDLREIGRPRQRRAVRPARRGGQVAEEALHRPVGEDGQHPPRRRAHVAVVVRRARRDIDDRAGRGADRDRPVWPQAVERVLPLQDVERLEGRVRVQ